MTPGHGGAPIVVPGGVVPSAPAHDAAVAAEERRVRDVYARRREGGRYSWLDPAYLLAMQQIERGLLGALRRHLGDGAGEALGALRVLEVGCGRGAWLQRLIGWGVDPHRLSGIDLLEDRIATALRVCAPGTDARVATATALPYASATFDVVLQVTAFSSILDPGVRAAAAAEMRRVVRPGGAILWYDLRVDNPRNPDVRGIRRAELVRLFPGWRADLRAVTLAPPLARRVAAVAPGAARLLGGVPWLCTHYLATLSAPAGRTAP